MEERRQHKRRDDIKYDHTSIEKKVETKNDMHNMNKKNDGKKKKNSAVT